MSSATWRRRIVSQFSCQTSRGVNDRCFQRSLTGEAAPIGSPNYREAV
jgi:hypothetical protein